jgi:hypothetical protein
MAMSKSWAVVFPVLMVAIIADSKASIPSFMTTAVLTICFISGGYLTVSAMAISVLLITKIKFNSRIC